MSPRPDRMTKYREKGKRISKLNASPNASYHPRDRVVGRSFIMSYADLLLSNAVAETQGVVRMTPRRRGKRGGGIQADSSYPQPRNQARRIGFTSLVKSGRPC
jgi:hypothetical protein